MMMKKSRASTASEEGSRSTVRVSNSQVFLAEIDLRRFREVVVSASSIVLVIVGVHDSKLWVAARKSFGEPFAVGVVLGAAVTGEVRRLRRGRNGRHHEDRVSEGL